MNAPAQKQESAALVAAPRQQFDLSPQTFDQALQFSEYLAASEMVPKAYRGKAGDCLIAMQWGMEIGLKPLQALQSIATINGKPGIFGDAGKAILLAAGCIIEEDDMAKVRENGFARCKITRPGRPPTERTFSEADAATAGLWGKEGPWRTYPYRQMMWRAFWFAARDAASDLLRGLNGAEELVDYQGPEPKNMGTAEEVKTGETGKPALPPYPADKFEHNLKNTWARRVAEGSDPDNLIVKLKTLNTLTAEQESAIKALKRAAAAPASDAPTATAAEVLEKINAAKTSEELDEAASLIPAVPEAERAALNARYDELHAKFNPQE